MSREFKIFNAHSFPPEKRKPRIEVLDYDEGYNCNNCLHRTIRGHDTCPGNPAVEYWLNGSFLFCEHHETDGSV